MVPPQNKILCVWDGKHSDRRKSLYPEYNGNRKPKTDLEKQVKDLYMKNYIEQQTILRDEVLPTIGICSVTHWQKEGDDVIYKLCELYHDKTDIIVISEDKDMFQLIHKFPTIKIYRPIAQEAVYKENFMEKAGVSPELFLINKALLGDNSDNISHIPQVGKDTVPLIVNKLDINNPVGSLLTMTQAAALEDKAKGTRSKLGRVYEDWGIIARNLELVDMSREVFDNQELINFKALVDGYRKVVDSTKFGQLCARFGFQSILKDIEFWLLPFKN